MEYLYRRSHNKTSNLSRRPMIRSARMTSDADKQVNYSTEIIKMANFARISNFVLFCLFPHFLSAEIR